MECNDEPMFPDWAAEEQTRLEWKRVAEIIKYGRSDIAGQKDIPAPAIEKVTNSIWRSEHPDKVKMDAMEAARKPPVRIQHLISPKKQPMKCSKVQVPSGAPFVSEENLKNFYSEKPYVMSAIPKDLPKKTKPLCFDGSGPYHPPDELQAHQKERDELRDALVHSLKPHSEGGGAPNFSLVEEAKKYGSWKPGLDNHFFVEYNNQVYVIKSDRKTPVTSYPIDRKMDPRNWQAEEPKEQSKNVTYSRLEGALKFYAEASSHELGDH